VNEFRVSRSHSEWVQTGNLLKKWEKSFKISFAAYHEHHHMPDGQACIASIDFCTECVRRGHLIPVSNHIHGHYIGIN
jgi:hypothetical protein